MKTKSLFNFMPVLLTGVIFIIIATALAQDNSEDESDSGLNLAVVAEPSCSYISGDTSLTALNDENEPRSSRDRRRGSYGNWPRRGTQWIQYDWSRSISTRKIEVYWWDDRRGVRLPKACRLLYWNGEDFIPVSNPSGLGVAESKYNTTTFDEVQTSKLKLEIDSNDTSSTGLLEWKVYDSGTWCRWWTRRCSASTT